MEVTWVQLTHKQEGGGKNPENHQHLAGKSRKEWPEKLKKIQENVASESWERRTEWKDQSLLDLSSAYQCEPLQCCGWGRMELLQVQDGVESEVKQRVYRRLLREPPSSLYCVVLPSRNLTWYFSIFSVSSPGPGTKKALGPFWRKASFWHLVFPSIIATLLASLCPFKSCVPWEWRGFGRRIWAAD